MSNISSIIALKSELNKRKAEAHSKNVNNTKNSDLYSSNQSTIKFLETAKPAKKQKIDIIVNQTNEFDNQKAFENLERKSKLYDKLTQNKNDSLHEDVLVDFNNKYDYNSKMTSSSNVKSFSSTPFNDFKESKIHEVPEESEFNYYTNVLNTEIREHGTGYYKFSSNIDQRNEQLNEIKKFQSEIEKEKMNLHKIKELEKEKLQLRLEKIKQKYGAEVPVDDLLPKFQVAEDSENCVGEDNKDTTIDDLLCEIRANTQTKSKREWDRGKKPFKFENIKNKLRDDRDDSFAPPLFY